MKATNDTVIAAPSVREYIDTLVLARGFEMAASPTA
jgi:hypothetical protein